MHVIAHIGNVPVEEWLPFLVPAVALYLYGRRKNRVRREAVEHLPDVNEALDAQTVELVLDRWAKRNHEHLTSAHLPLLYPPGPDGMNASELAARIHSDQDTVTRLLAELEDLGYLDLDDPDSDDGPRALLTIEGYELVYETEAALLARVSSSVRRRGPPGASGLGETSP